VHDIERCMAKLEEGEGRLIARLALQRHTHEETARLMGLSLSTVLRRYEQAIDCLTRIFLEARLLERLVFCQGAEEGEMCLSN
jgi:DNA-directed RNA polymerase specialized sigma24 family protein